MNLANDLRTRKLNGAIQLGDGRSLRALGLWPFWGSAIAVGAKQNETRGWYRGFTGPLAIYQTKTFPASVNADYDRLRHLTGAETPFGIPSPKSCPTSCIVAVCRVVHGVQSPAIKGDQVTARFWKGDGYEESRIVPPPAVPETLLGNYDSIDQYDMRYAWVLTDIMPLPEPVNVPQDGTIRQGIFTLPDSVALPILSAYREYLIGLRPTCKYCGSPLGGAMWKHTLRDGWHHICKNFSGGLFVEECLDNPHRAKAFLPGWFPEVPASPSADDPPPPKSERAETLTLF